MAKGMYQLPPCTLMVLLLSKVWCLVGLKLINNGFTYASAHELYRKGI